MVRKKKRSSFQIYKEILSSLSSNGQEMTINEIAKAVGINWSTARNKLVEMQKLGLVKETVNHRKLRLFVIV